MNVLMLSTDANILRNSTEVRRRMEWYGTVFTELHIIIFSRNVERSEWKITIAKNVFLYPSTSKSKLLCLWNGYRIAKKIIFNTRAQHDMPLWVVTAQDPFETGYIGFLLKRKFHLPFQLQIHTDFLSPYFWNESFKNKIRIFLARFLLLRADGIRAVSERIKKSLLKEHPTRDRITVLPIFVETETIHALTVINDLHRKYSSFDFIILTASRLTREKNLGMAINAMKEVIKKIPKALLLIVGDGPERKNLEYIVHRLSLASHVVFEPSVDLKTLVSYYKSADLFLLTSNYEGYGRTVVEALLAGCPVIMTDVGVAGEMVFDDVSGSVVLVGDSAGLRDAILHLLQNPDKRARYRLEGMNIADRMVCRDKTRYVELYKNALMKLLP